MEWIIATIALLLTYLGVRLVFAAFIKSRCHNAGVSYNFWENTISCNKCGMRLD